MAEGFGISNAASGVQSNLSGVSASQAADAAATLPAAPQTDVQPTRTSTQGATTFAPDPPATEVHSKVVQRLLEQNATVYGPGLARLPLPARPDGVPRTLPKKPAGPMGAPRALEGGNSPIAPGSLADARGSYELIGRQPNDGGEGDVLANAQEGAWRMPSRHGLVAYTMNERGERVYLTSDRMLHIRENHMDAPPQPRGKRTTTYWPTRYAADGQPSMTEQQVIGVIMDTARKGVLRNEVRDTRMAEYDLPAEQAKAYGVTEAKVSMAPDGLILSAFPAAGPNVLAVYELGPDDHAALQRATSTAASNAQVDGEDTRMFRTNIASTSFG